MNEDDAREVRHRLKEPVVADRREVTAPFVRQHQRQAVYDQRFDDARHQPLAEADHVEVAVEVARESNQRAAVVVAVAIEHAIERVLHRLANRLRQQDDDDGGEQRDDPVVGVGVVGEQETDRLAHREVQRGAGAEERGVCRRRA